MGCGGGRGRRGGRGSVRACASLPLCVRARALTRADPADAGGSHQSNEGKRSEGSVCERERDGEGGVC